MGIWRSPSIIKENISKKRDVVCNIPNKKDKKIIDNDLIKIVARQQNHYPQH